MRCMNRKVLVGAGLLAVAVLLFAPSRAAGLLPVLLMMLCPLGMLAMMRPGGAPASSGTLRSEATDVPTQSPTVEERIGALQAELRSLKEAQARADAAPERPERQSDAPASPPTAR